MSRSPLAAASALALLLALSASAQAQFGGGQNGGGGGLNGGGINGFNNANAFINRQVGGVAINVDGVLSNVDPQGRKELAELRRKSLEQLPAELSTAAPLRMVSLRALDEALSRIAENKEPLTDDLRFLAGLQRIRYIFVDPDNKDIVLAGPAEPWKVDALGNVVGVNSGCPVLRLDDLLVALRSADSARNGGISCSIDPTPEGVARLQASIAQQTRFTPGVLKDYEQALGPQSITVTGVPDESRFARVLVAADYRMKRLAMKMDEPPIRGLPSYMDMVSANSAMFPRWWLSPNYDALHKDPEGLAWELRGVGVKCLTAEDTFAVDGRRAETAKASPIAQKWADNMTAKYAELAAKEPVFAELQNCIDLAVVAALIQKEHLAERADCRTPFLYDAKKCPTDRFLAPKQVDSKATAVKKGKNWVISASGGVLVQPWEMIQTATDSAEVSAARGKAVAARKPKQWWWN